MNINNKKGFTLIELLVTIALLGLVISITMYFTTSAIRNAKNKTYETTINEVEKAAGNYLVENSDELFFISNGDIEYQCINVQNLIDYGFLNSDVTKSQIDSDGTKIGSENFIYIERSTATKAIQKKIYITDINNGYSRMCAASTITTGSINFILNPSNKWSRKKIASLNYKLFNVADRSNYVYEYTVYSCDNYNYNCEVVKMESNNVSNKEFNVEQNGYIYADIKNIIDNTEFLSSTYDVDKIDKKGPTIELVNSNEIKQYFKKNVTIPLHITDCEDNNCSGLRQYSDDELANMLLENKIVVKVDNKNINNSVTLTKKSDGLFELVIKNTTDNGDVTIFVSKNTFFDTVVDEEKNGNEEVTLDPNIMLDNILPVVDFVMLDSNTNNTVSSNYYSLDGSDSDWFNFIPKLKFVGNDSGSGLRESATIFWNKAGHNELVTTLSGSSEETWNNQNVIIYPVTENGYRYIKLYVCDKASNCINKKVYFKFDNVAPEIDVIMIDANNNVDMPSNYYSLDGSDSDWFNFTPKLKFVGNDNVSGLDSNVTTSWNASGNGTLNTTLVSTNAKTWNGNVVTYNVTENGYRYVKFHACDMANNCVDKNVYFKFDNVTPNINFIMLNSINNSEVSSNYYSLDGSDSDWFNFIPKLKFVGNDNVSGLDSNVTTSWNASGNGTLNTTLVSTNAKTWNGNVVTYNVTENGYRYVKFHACDMANNCVDKNVYFKFDNVTPNINFIMLNSINNSEVSSNYYSLDGSDSDWFNFTPKLKFVGSDNVSGLDSNVTTSWNASGNNTLNTTLDGSNTKTWNNNIVTYNISGNGYRYIEFHACDIANNCVDKKVYFKLDNIKPTLNVNSTSDMFSETQTLNLVCQDTIGITGYYVGMDSPSNNSYTLVDESLEIDVDVNINGSGTYYVACKDIANNEIIKSVNYSQYTVKYMLLNASGTAGIYNTNNYSMYKNSSYILPNNLQLLLRSFNSHISGNVAVGSNVNKFRGVSSGEPGTTSATLLTSNPTVSNNSIYSLWFDRNTITIKYNANGGVFASATTNGYSLDANGLVYKDNDVRKDIYNYDQYLSDNGLLNYNNSSHLNLKKDGYSVVSNKEWKDNSTIYSQYMVFNASSICDASLDDCERVLYVNWVVNENYIIDYVCNGGMCNGPTSGAIDSVITINNPTKTVTITGNVNGTGATIGGSVSVSQDFSGWTSSSGDGLGTGAKTGNNSSNLLSWSGSSTKNKYFKNLNSNSGTVKMTANWTSKSVTLPTVSRTGYTCKWNTKADGTGTAYNSGGSYTISSTSSSNIILYARCSINTVTVRYHANGGSLNTTNSDFSLSNGTVLYYGTSDFLVINYNGSTSSDGLANYNNSNWINLEKNGYSAPAGSEWYATVNGETHYYNQAGVIRASDLCPTIAIESCIIDLYVNWKINTVTIRYHANGGTMANSNTSYKLDNNNDYVLYNGNKDFHVIEYGNDTGSNGLYNYDNSGYIKLVKAGYSAPGGSEWYTVVDGTVKTYSQAGALSANTLCPNIAKKSCVVDMYVNWKCWTTFNTNANNINWSSGDSNLTVKFDSVYSFSSLPPLSRTGYSLNGWRVGSANSSTIYTQNVREADNDCGKTLYANWKCKVTFNANGGNWSLGNNYTVEFDSIYSFKSLPSLPTRNGYTLSGWRVGSANSSTIYTQDVREADNDCGKTLYANWVQSTPSSYTVKLYPNGGYWLSSNWSGNPYVATYTNTLSIKDRVKRNGYAFVGWAVGSSTSNTIYHSYVDASDNNKELYAKWDYTGDYSGNCYCTVESDCETDALQADLYWIKCELGTCYWAKKVQGGWYATNYDACF